MTPSNIQLVSHEQPLFSIWEHVTKFYYPYTIYAAIAIIIHLPQPHKFATHSNNVLVAYVTSWQREILRKPLK